MDSYTADSILGDVLRQYPSLRHLHSAAEGTATGALRDLIVMPEGDARRVQVARDFSYLLRGTQLPVDLVLSAARAATRRRTEQ